MTDSCECSGTGEVADTDLRNKFWYFHVVIHIQIRHQ